MLGHTPDDDVVLIDVGSEVAAVENPSVAHHHTSPAATLPPQGRRQAGLRQRGQSQSQLLLGALEAQGRGQIPGRRSVRLHEHGDVQEAFRAGQGPEVVQTPARLAGS